MKSWKTTMAAIAALIAAIAGAVGAWLDGNPDTVADWGAIIPLATIAIGLLFARDNDKSSEDVGAK